MSLIPNAFPDAQSIITEASSSDFAHALGPKLGVGNELRIDTCTFWTAYVKTSHSCSFTSVENT